MGEATNPIDTSKSLASPITKAEILADLEIVKPKPDKKEAKILLTGSIHTKMEGTMFAKVGENKTTEGASRRRPLFPTIKGT